MTSTASTLVVVEEIGPPLSGLFLCAEPDQTVFTFAILQLGTNPVEPTSHTASIVGVLVRMESFKDERPFVWTEMNGFGGLSLAHACSLLEWSVL